MDSDTVLSYNFELNKWHNIKIDTDLNGKLKHLIINGNYLCTLSSNFPLPFEHLIFSHCQGFRVAQRISIKNLTLTL